MDSFETARNSVFMAVQALVKKGMLLGSGGNVSLCPGGDWAAITPSSIDYAELKIEDICIVDLSGQLKDGQSTPSIETAMHLAVYEQRGDVGAVIHTHQVFASVLGLVGKPIPALFDEQVRNLGGSVDIIPYALSGSAELKQSVAAAVVSRNNAYLLENHGALLLGTTLAEAVRNAALLEKTAEVYWQVVSAGLSPRLLPEESRESVFGLLKSKQQKEIRRRRRLGEHRGEGAERGTDDKTE